MVVNRKTRSTKPATGSARAAGKALQKNVAAESPASEPVTDAADGTSASASSPEPALAPLTEAAIESGTPESETILDAEPVAQVEETVESGVESVVSNSDELGIVAEVNASASGVSSAPQSVGSSPIQPAPIQSSPIQSSKGETLMTQDTQTTAIAQTGSTLGDRPVLKSDFTAVGSIVSAGERPIEASTMAVFGTILNGRPIEASSLKLFEMLPGDRPVFANEVTYLDAGLPGGRPIMVSPAGMLAASMLPGGRPIFTNSTVDPDSASLMGYLD